MWIATVPGVQLCLLTFQLRYVIQHFYWLYCEISNAWNDREGVGSVAVDCVRSMGFFIDFILPATLWPSGRLSLELRCVPGIGEKGWQTHGLHVSIF
jgi:hypothetical protein